MLFCLSSVAQKASHRFGKSTKGTHYSELVCYSDVEKLICNFMEELNILTLSITLCQGTSEQWKCEVVCCPTSEMTADMFTKDHSREQFCRLLEKVRIVHTDKCVQVELTSKEEC